MILQASNHVRTQDEIPKSTPKSVLMIVGTGRSGSTILGSLLGETDRYIHVGELNYIWSRGLVENRQCGCGVGVRECSFWQEVFGDAYGGIDKVDLADVLKTKALIERTRTLPRLLNQNRSKQLSERFERYKHILAALYGSIAKVSRADVIVDSSKAPQYAYLVDMIPEIDLRTIHLIRDSRAVAYSKRRKRIDPSFASQTVYLNQENIISSSVIWNVVHSILFSRPPGSQSISLRYEDFVADPGKALGDISKLMSGRTSCSPHARDHFEVTHQNHTVSGNPVRFKANVKITPDMEWITKMPASNRALVTALTLPVLLRAGYSIAPFTAYSSKRERSNAPSKSVSVVESET
jgi:hypothetical protein